MDREYGNHHGYASVDQTDFTDPHQTSQFWSGDNPDHPDGPDGRAPDAVFVGGPKTDFSRLSLALMHEGHGLQDPGSSTHRLQYHHKPVLEEMRRTAFSGQDFFRFSVDELMPAEVMLEFRRDFEDESEYSRLRLLMKSATSFGFDSEYPYTKLLMPDHWRKAKGTPQLILCFDAAQTEQPRWRAYLQWILTQFITSAKRSHERHNDWMDRLSVLVLITRAEKKLRSGLTANPLGFTTNVLDATFFQMLRTDLQPITKIAVGYCSEYGLRSPEESSTVDQDFMSTWRPFGIKDLLYFIMTGKETNAIKWLTSAFWQDLNRPRINNAPIETWRPF